MPSSGRSSIARRASASVCGRGTNTPGSIPTRRPQNVTEPVIHASGSPRSRRRTSSSIGPTPSRAAVSKLSASASGATQPPSASSRMMRVRCSLIGSPSRSTTRLRVDGPPSGGLRRRHRQPSRLACASRNVRSARIRYRGQVVPHDGASNEVVQRLDPVARQCLGPVHRAEDRSGRRARAVGVPSALDREADRPREVALPPEERGRDEGGVVDGVDEAVVAVADPRSRPAPPPNRAPLVQVEHVADGLGEPRAWRDERERDLDAPTARRSMTKQPRSAPRPTSRRRCRSACATARRPGRRAAARAAGRPGETYPHMSRADLRADPLPVGVAVGGGLGRPTAVDQVAVGGPLRRVDLGEGEMVQPFLGDVARVRTRSRASSRMCRPRIV